MPVQNSNHKVFAYPDLVTQLLQIIVNYVYEPIKKEQFTICSHVLDNGLLGKYLVIIPYIIHHINSSYHPKIFREV